MAGTLERSQTNLHLVERSEHRSPDSLIYEVGVDYVWARGDISDPDNFLMFRGRVSSPGKARRSQGLEYSVWQAYPQNPENAEHGVWHELRSPVGRAASTRIKEVLAHVVEVTLTDDN
jgi:hypothetical protein